MIEKVSNIVERAAVFMTLIDPYDNVPNVTVFIRITTVYIIYKAGIY